MAAEGDFSLGLRNVIRDGFDFAVVVYEWWQSLCHIF